MSRSGDDANRWWDSLPEQRWIQIHQWIDPPADAPVIHPNQIALMEDIANVNCD